MSKKKFSRKNEWKQSRIDKKIHICPEYHLIVTEGKKTEPNYFTGFKELINQNGYGSRLSIKIEGEGVNTLSLLDRARKYVKEDHNPIKHVWLVYDKDDFPKDDFDNTKKCCDAISKVDVNNKLEDVDSNVKYHAIWSNQCIELWFLLHFAYYHVDNTREQYEAKLTSYLSKMNYGKYQKNRGDIFNILFPYVDTAIKNAKKLADLFKDETPSRSAPCTMVFEFVEKIKPYLKKP